MRRSHLLACPPPERWLPLPRAQGRQVPLGKVERAQGKILRRGAQGQAWASETYLVHMASSSELGLDPGAQGRVWVMGKGWWDSGRGHMQRGRSSGLLGAESAAPVASS